MTDRIFATAAKWALAADNLQWIVCCKRGGQWRKLSFVHSTRDVLERCLREKGCPKVIADVLLAPLPLTFDEWKIMHSTPSAGQHRPS